MSDDLFPIEPSAPTPLQKARQRLAKAQAEVDRAERLHDEQGPQSSQILDAVFREMKSAANSVQVEENKVLEKLKHK